MGKKPIVQLIVSVTYENERISIKISLPYIKCVLRGPRAADLWPFYGFLCKQFSLYIKVETTGRFMGFYVNGFLPLYREPFT